MYGIIKMSGIFYARDLSQMDDQDKEDFIDSFVSEGNAVIIVNEIEDADEYTDGNVEIVEPEQD